MRGKRLLMLVAVLAIMAIPTGCNIFRRGGTRPAPTRPRRPEVGGFYVNDPGGFDSLPSLKAHSDILDEIYPLWYHVKPDGSLEEEPNEQAIDFAHKQGIKIFPLVNVVPNQDTVLLDPTARDNAIGNIVRIVKAQNYDGANIDFEFIPTTGKQDFSADRDQMTQFMKLLNEQFKKLGKKTHMSVLPHVGVTADVSGIYDYSKLAPYVDKVTVMCYDFSREGSPPGPLAPFSWVQSNITTAIKQGFKPEQICLGVATYGYDWPAGKSGGFSNPSKALLEKAATKGYEVKWSDRYQAPYYVYTDPSTGAQREVWFENAATLKTKIQLVNKYKLSGVCIWRLGFEDPKFWDTLAKSWGKRK